ncbi:MAG: GNAT family N-acetyltransferase [Austwickia sp.]|nr:MAG: GNAT family N-acetyltransferase [Austwickia sp.]
MGLTDTNQASTAAGEPRRLSLRDGSMVWMRPLRRQDREPISTWYDTLSPDTKRHRFLAEEEHLSPRMLDYLVDGVDGADHVAMVILSGPATDASPTETRTATPARTDAATATGRDADGEIDDGTRLVGVARLVRLESDPTAADIAVTIDDAWHGRGLATAILPVLLADRPAGVTHLRTSVARDNPASMAMLRRVGKLRAVGVERGVVEVEIDLGTP